MDFGKALLTFLYLSGAGILLLAVIYVPFLLLEAKRKKLRKMD